MKQYLTHLFTCFPDESLYWEGNKHFPHIKSVEMISIVLPEKVLLKKYSHVISKSLLIFSQMFGNSPHLISTFPPTAIHFVISATYIFQIKRPVLSFSRNLYPMFLDLFNIAILNSKCLSFHSLSLARFSFDYRYVDVFFSLPF